MNPKTKEFIKYLLIGGINTLVGYLLFTIFIFLKFYYLLALLMSTSLGIVFNFFSIGKVVFNNLDTSLLFRFVLNYLILFLVNVLACRLFLFFLSSALICGYISMSITAILGFFLNRALFKFTKSNLKN